MWPLRQSIDEAIDYDHKRFKAIDEDKVDKHTCQYKYHILKNVNVWIITI